MKKRNAVLVGTLAILFASSAFGQNLEFRKWDLSTSLGIIGGPVDFSGIQRPRYAEPGFIWNIDAGRYFTPHLKAEAGLMWTNPRRFFVSNDGFDYVHGKAHPITVSGAVTYQFLKNVFAHPYVSAGMWVTSVYEDTTTVRYSSNFAASTSSSGSRRFTQVRPFMAVGYKSYFNERVYVRSEFLIAVDKLGPSHGTLRAGAGFDF